MIFEDATGRRWRRTRKAVLVTATALGLVLADAVVGAYTTPNIASANIVPPVGPVVAMTEEILTGVPASALPVVKALVARAEPDDRSRRSRFANLPVINSAFVIQDDPRSFASLQAHVNQLQVVFPDWLAFANNNGSIDHKVDPALALMLKSSGALIMPRLSNTSGAGVWFAEGLPQLFADPDATDIFIDNLVEQLTSMGADGVNIDIEELQQDENGAYVAWLETVISVLHEKGFAVTVDVPMNDEAYDYKAIGQIADAVVLMAYDQHYSTSVPGPIAGRDWFADGVASVSKRISPSKLIMGIGAYGYDWTEGKREAEAIGFTEALQLADHAHQRIVADGPDVNGHFDYEDEDAKRHHVWMLDAVSAWNHYQSAKAHGVRGVAVWRLGIEEPSLWSFYGQPADLTVNPATLAALPAPNLVNFSGDGEMVRVHGSHTVGSRQLDIVNGQIVKATTVAPSRPYDVQRFGKLDQKLIALTFDDGPDPLWTPQVLAVLAKYNAQGTFFVIGDEAQKFPGILADTYKAGHLIGNHTFSHPDLRVTPLDKLTSELNATQRVIESVTGHSTILFRSPYDIDAAPTTVQQLAPLGRAAELGYIFAAADIDTFDYLHPTVEKLVSHVLANLKDGKSHVILMHDGGGDRRQTLLGLEKLIPLLQSQGYTFVGLDTLMGVDASKLMPGLALSELPFVLGTAIQTWFRGNGSLYGWGMLQILFTATTLIAIARIMLLGGLIWNGSRKAGKPVDPAFLPPVRVLVPAHNEAKVIERTLNTLLTSDYPNLAVTVIDDGSTDDTPDIVRAFAKLHPSIELIVQANGGKAEALNNGFRQSREDILVTIDADTIVFPHTVRRLVEPFADPTVDAVCGNVQVGNVKNMLTAFQNVEYVTSQNYDRRAFETLNCISVVPGATGAWKRRKVLEVGGYSTQTLTEDADLTLKLLAHSGRITYAPQAISATEAPETLQTLFRQRFRWSFGTFQCLWKYRRSFGKGTLGWIALPNMLMFQILLPLLAPVGDGLLISCLWRGDLPPIVAGYVMFLILDLIGAVVAFGLDRRRPTAAWVILIQRFYYRQFLYVVTFAAVLAVLRGGRRGWNKLERTGNMTVEVPLALAA